MRTCRKSSAPPAGRWRALYEKFLNAAKTHDCAIELNTAGLRKDCREIYPIREIWRCAFEKGVPITFGSDAHAPEEVGTNFPEAMRLAQDVGYRESCRFTKENVDGSNMIPTSSLCSRPNRQGNQFAGLIAWRWPLVTAALYWPIMHHAFVDFDDEQYITEIPCHRRVDFGRDHLGLPNRICRQLASVDLAFAHAGLPVVSVSTPAGITHQSVFSRLQHLVVIRLVQKITGALWRSAIVAALFAWHPLHVESVAWAAERKDVLSAFFWKLTSLRTRATRKG